MVSFITPEDLERQLLLDLKPLPALSSLLSIPPLEDKPQNPIIQTIHSRVALERVSARVVQQLPKELVIISEQVLQSARRNEEESEDDLWQRAAVEAPLKQGQLASWDSFRRTYKPSSRFASPFLTEQAPDVVNAARYHTYPRFYDPSHVLVHVTSSALIEDLKSTVVACSSRYHMWDSSVEQFVVSPNVGGAKAVIVVDGMDEVISKSYLARFLQIGTLLRRLETMATKLPKTTSIANSTAFAFAIALSSVLVYLRRQTTEVVADNPGSTSADLCALWLALEATEQALDALASLCHRDISLEPKSYKSLPPEPVQLLSHIFGHVEAHIERHSPKEVVALLARVLTMTSRPYFGDIGRSIALNGLEHAIADMRKKSKQPLEGVDELSGNDEESQEDDLELDSEDSEDVGEFPSFFSKDLVNAIIRARRSLRILVASGLEGSISLSPPVLPEVEWIWTGDEVTALLQGKVAERRSEDETTRGHQSPTPPINEQDSSAYKPELAALALYDLEPGTTSTTTTRSDNLVAFLRTFPSTLPALTPTLTTLTTLITAPILAQADSLSTASLQLFMTPSAPLHLRSHLTVLRSYLLLTAHAFKTRLGAALFSDSDTQESTGSLAERTRTRSASASGKVAGAGTGERADHFPPGPWAVGLAFSLTEREMWPPGGSDLGFYLRRVIFDSLEHVRAEEAQCHGGVDLGSEEFWGEAEARLGFAIRDLPVGTGREKWLDPTRIEALDFLYMVYKPPRPLRCLITSDILSKYQRVFTFLLRLLRVEHAMRLIYRLVRKSSRPLFPTIPSSNALLLHFRFIGTSFISALSSYLYDTAIGANFDAFLSRLSLAERSPDFFLPGVFADVYSLMQHHSAVLDDILSAALLRSGQHAVGDVLRGCLEDLLKFGVLVGELYRGRFTEADATRRMERLYERFRGKMRALLKSLKRCAANGDATPAVTSPRASEKSGDKRARAAGGVEALGDLAVRLDVAEWWTRAPPISM